VALGDGGEQMLAADEDRHQESVVGRMGVAAVRIVVEIRIALADIALVVSAHILALQMGAENVHRQALGRGKQLIVAREDAAREIPGARYHRRTRRAQQRVGHLANDAVEPVGDDGHHHRIESIGSRRAL
jgi:hypothetical protein